MEYLDLSDTLSGLPFDDAQQTFEAFADGLKDLHLKYLDLSDNALGPNGFISCKGLIEVASLLKINEIGKERSRDPDFE